MNKMIIGICLFALVLSGCKKDSTFSCVGTIEEDFTFDTNQPSHFKIKDKIGLVIKEKQIVLVGSQNLDVPTMYQKNGKSDFNYEFSFPICSNKNYEISANNYSCDINVIKNAEKNLPYKMADNYEIKFNSLTNVLSVQMSPSVDKLIHHIENKISYKIFRANYQCSPTSSSL